MAMTFADCYRIVRLYASSAPLLLVREWVNQAYKELGDARPWSFLRGETRLRFAAARDVTVTVTDGSTTVSGTGVFSSADVGRQLRVGMGATYTIVAVPDTDTATLDQAYADITATTTARILDAYVTLPADFGTFRLIADLYNQRQIAFWLTEDQVQMLDPRRAFSDTGIRILCPVTPSPVAATLGQIRYEGWPRATGARTYPAFYTKRPQGLTEDTTFTGVLAEGADVLVLGALAQAAAWPGTIDQRNPFFNLAVSQKYRANFLAGVQRLSLKDDAQAPDDAMTVHWGRWPVASLAYNDQALRASDAGGGGYY